MAVIYRAISILLLLSIYIYPVNNQQFDNIVSLKDNLTLSSYFQNITRSKIDNKFTDTDFVVETKPTVQHYESSITSLPRFVHSSDEVLDYYVDSVTRDGAELDSGLDYGYNLTYSESLVTDQPRPIVKYSNRSKHEDKMVEFTLNQPDILIEFNSDSPLDIETFVTVDNLFIGIKSDRLYIYKYYQMSVILVKKGQLFKDSWNIEEKNVKSLVLDSNFDKESRYLSITDSENTVYVYRINLKSPDSFTQVFKFEDEKLKEFSIADFVHRGDYLYLGLKFGGILVVKEAKVIKYIDQFETSGETLHLSLIDIQEVENSIYILIENYGLKILNVTNPENASFTSFSFFHPFIKKLEIHRNRHVSYFFLGLIVSDRGFTSGNEFFFELSLQDEFNPTLYKAYLSDKYFQVKTILNDDKYTYLYEHNSNYILVICRSITNSPYNAVFKVHVEHLKNRDIVGMPVMFTDSTLSSRHLGFNTKDKFVYSRDVELTSAEIFTKFHREGMYTIKLHTFTDSCQKADGICKVTLQYSYHVWSLPSVRNSLKGKLFSTMFVLFVLYNLVTLFVYIRFYYKQTQVEVSQTDRRRSADKNRGKYAKQHDESKDQSENENEDKRHKEIVISVEE